MKFYEKLLYHAAAYSVAVSILFFSFASIMSVQDLSLSFGRFMVIVAFGLVLSTAEFIFTVKKIPRWLQYIIHYLILAIAFFAIFLSIRRSDGAFEFTAATAFAAVIIFTVFYFIGVGILYAFKKALCADGVKSHNKEARENANKKQNYTSKFKRK